MTPEGPKKEHLKKQLARAQGHLTRMDGHLKRERAAYEKASTGAFFPSYFPSTR